MEQQKQNKKNRKRFHNAHEWRRFLLLWVTIFFWFAFLSYMIGFHFFRESVEPIIMKHIGITKHSNYQYVEIKLFIYLIWSCTIISTLAIINTWNKKRREGDNTPDKFLVVIMGITVAFSFYYAKTDLNYLNGQFSLLQSILE